MRGNVSSWDGNLALVRRVDQIALEVDGDHFLEAREVLASDEDHVSVALVITALVQDNDAEGLRQLLDWAEELPGYDREHVTAALSEAVDVLSYYSGANEEIIRLL